LPEIFPTTADSPS